MNIAIAAIATFGALAVCAALGLPRATFYRWLRPAHGPCAAGPIDRRALIRVGYHPDGRREWTERFLSDPAPQLEVPMVYTVEGR